MDEGGDREKKTERVRETSQNKGEAFFSRISILFVLVLTKSRQMLHMMFAF